MRRKPKPIEPLTDEQRDRLGSHVGLVGKVAMSMLKRKFKAEYGDMLSDGFFGLVKASRSFDESRGKFTTFACMCIECAIRDAARKRYRRPMASIDRENDDGFHVDAEDKRRRGDTLLSDYGIDVESLLKKADRRDRRLLRLKYVEGKQPTEIAKEIRRRVEITRYHIARCEQRYARFMP